MLKGSLDISVSVRRAAQFASAAIATQAIAETIAETVGVPRDRIVVRSIEVVDGRRLQASNSSIVRVDYDILVPENKTLGEITSAMDAAVVQSGLGGFTQRLVQNLASQGASEDLTSITVVRIHDLAPVTINAGGNSTASTTIAMATASSGGTTSEDGSGGFDPALIGATGGGLVATFLLTILGLYCYKSRKTSKQLKEEKAYFQNCEGWGVVGEQVANVKLDYSSKVVPEEDVAAEGMHETPAWSRKAKKATQPPKAEDDVGLEGLELLQACGCRL